MNRAGCTGLIVGVVIGLVVIGLFLAGTQPAPPDDIWPPDGIPPDVTTFVSEQTLSRLATEQLGQAAVLDFEPGGQLWVTTKTPLGGYQPVVQVGLSLRLQGADVVSRLEWIKLAYLTIPANWLPADARALAASIGETIEMQIPPDFTLVGLNTTTNGISLQLKWSGR
jgi:hypothetical protein